MRRLLVVLVLFAAPSLAQEPTPTPRFVWGSYSWSQSLFKAGSDKKLILGSRIDAEVDLFAGVHLFGRLDASAMQDGGAVNVQISDPETFSTLEGYACLWRDVYGPIALAGVYGLAVPIEGGKAAVLERYPQTLGFGVLVGDGSGDLWALVALGRHDAAGSGLKLLITTQIPMVDRTSIVADAAIGGPGTFARVGLAVRLK